MPEVMANVFPITTNLGRSENVFSLVRMYRLRVTRTKSRCDWREASSVNIHLGMLKAQLENQV